MKLKEHIEYYWKMERYQCCYCHKYKKIKWRGKTLSHVFFCSKRCLIKWLKSDGGET